MTEQNHTGGVAQQPGKPIAFVPVHPRNGPLWSDAYAADSFSERSPNYPRMALYAAQPPAAPVETGAMEGELDAVVQLIHKHVDVRDLFDGAQELTGVETAARAILAALRSDGAGGNQPEKRTGLHRASGETNSGATGDSELTRSARPPSDPNSSAETSGQEG